MFYLNAVLVPLIGAFIGWVTNLLAVKLLFRPYKPFKFYRWTLQGVLPKRRYELARNLGRIIEKEILSIDDILAHLKEREVPERMVTLLRETIRQAVLEKVPGWVPLAVKRPLAEALCDLVGERMPFIIDWVVESLSDTIKREVSLSRLIEEKLNSFPLEDLERVVFEVAAKEIKHIEIMGAVLGFFIGFIQVGVLFLLRLTGAPAF
ncbi:MAG: DUF445 family protein [Bacillota bacterium]